MQKPKDKEGKIKKEINGEQSRSANGLDMGSRDEEQEELRVSSKFLVLAIIKISRPFPTDS